MKRNVYFLRILIIAFILSVATIYSTPASTLILKSGKSVEGNILEKTNNYIKIDFHGVPLTFFNDEIKIVEEKQASNSAPVADKKSDSELDQYLESIKDNFTDQTITDTTKEISGGFYSNKEYGISFEEPKGWLRQAGDPKVDYLVRYTRPERSASIVITHEDIAKHSSIKTSLDFANEVLKSHLSIYPDTIVVKQPQEIDVNGIVASAIMYDNKASDKLNKSAIIVSTMQVFIMQGKWILTINMGGDREYWEMDIQDIGSIMNSLKV